MKKQIAKKREELGTVWHEYKSFRDSLPSDEGRWTSDQRAKFDRMDADVDRIEDEIESLVRADKDSDREHRYSQSQDGRFIPDNGNEYRSGHFYGGATEDQHFNFRANPEGHTQRHSFNRFLLDGRAGLTAKEFRAMQSDSDVGGGYITTPAAFVNSLIAGLNADVIIRKLATKYEIPAAASLGVPTLDADFADADWTTELSTGNEDDLSFGKRELKPHPIAKRIKVSRKLMRTAFLNPEKIVRDRMVYKFSVTEERAFLTGTGAQQPLGVFTASDSLPVSRDISVGNTTTAIKSDGLVEVLHALKPAYQRNASWIFHDDAVKMIRKMKDGDGQYIWQLGISAEKPATILGKPYFTSEYAPSTFTTGQYIGIVGDFSFYWIATALKMDVQVLDELYAEANQIGFIGRLEVDGMPVLAEAFARVTLA